MIENWQFGDSSGTQFSGITNDAGSATFSGDVSNITTNGSGALAYSQGPNVFRNANLTSPNQSTGIFQIEFSILAADLSGGDVTGANLGFGFRDETNTDLFLIRLHKQNDLLRLQTRISSTNTDVVNFNSDVLPSPLNVRAVVNLDTDMMDLFYTVGGGAEQSGGTFATVDAEFDQVRLLSNTNSTDWGATDFATVDFLTITAVPEPSSACVLMLAASMTCVRRRRLI